MKLGYQHNGGQGRAVFLGSRLLPSLCILTRERESMRERGRESERERERERGGEREHTLSEVFFIKTLISLIWAPPS